MIVVARPMVTLVLLPFLTAKRHSSPFTSSRRLERCRVVHLVFLDDVPKLQEAATRIFEEGAGRKVGVHLQHEVVNRNPGAWI